MNCVIYARYSSEKQNEKSIEDQIKACQEYAQANEFIVVNTYIDRAKSGKTDKRPAFQQMIEEADGRKYKYILCWKFDRISRNTRDYYYYEKILFDKGVSIVSINEMIDDPQAAPIIKAVNLGMAESYNVTLAINVNRGMRSNAKQCKSNGALPFGYTSDKKGIIYPDPVNAPFVEHAFKAFLSGASFKQIADYFNSSNVKTRFGNPWKGESIKRLLQNDKYTGIYKFADIVVENGMPVIVDKLTYLKVQEKMKNYTKKKKIDGQENYILYGKLKCNDCNHLMDIATGTSKTGKLYRYYKCGCRSIRKDFIEPLVIDLTKEYILTDEMIEKIADYAMDLQKEVKKNSKEHAFKQELKETDKKINKIIDLLMDGVDSETLRDKLDQLETEKRKLKVQIQLEEAYNQDVSRDAVVWYFKQFQDTTDPEMEADLVDKLIMQIFLDEETIWIQYKFAEKNKDTQLLSLKEIECSSNHHMVNHCIVYLNPKQFSITLKFRYTTI